MSAIHFICDNYVTNKFQLFILNFDQKIKNNQTILDKIIFGDKGDKEAKGTKRQRGQRGKGDKEAKGTKRQRGQRGKGDKEAKGTTSNNTSFMNQKLYPGISTYGRCNSHFNPFWK
jgi:hypothetical protein